MAEKTKKLERQRDPPRRLPDTDKSAGGTTALLIEGTPFEDICFSQLDLSARRMGLVRGSNLVFDRVSFMNSDIASLRLVDARFIGCDLSNTMLRSFECTRVEFIDCKLMGLNAFACRLDDVLIDHCDARFSQFSESRLRRCEITASQFQESALNRVIFEATRLHEVKLSQSDLAEAKLAGVDLSACDIEGITLRVEDLRGAIVSAPQAMELARFLEVVIK